MDPELQIVTKLRTVTNEPNAVLAEMLEIVLSRGDGVPAVNIRKTTMEVFEIAARKRKAGNCRYLNTEDFCPMAETSELRVGRSPSILQLRRGELFRRRRIVETVVRELNSVKTEADALPNAVS